MYMMYVKQISIIQTYIQILQFIFHKRVDACIGTMKKSVIIDASMQ